MRPGIVFSLHILLCFRYRQIFISLNFRPLLKRTYHTSSVDMTVTDEQTPGSAAEAVTSPSTKLEDDEEQIVNIETVEAKDNTGIDYERLISMETFIEIEIY